MYNGLLHTHNLLRWIILIVFAVSIILAFSGWLGKHKWKKRDKTAGLLLMVFIDLQFFTGIILYLFVSPVTKTAFSNFGAAMRNADLRFFAVEHIFLMVIALVVMHIGRAKSIKATASWKKHRVVLIYYTVSLILVLAAIPWERGL